MARRASKKSKIPVKGLKFLVIGLFAMFVVFVACNKTVQALQRAEFFRVREVVKSPTLQFIDSRHLSRLKGKSMFDVNLAAVEKRLQKAYPQIDQLKVLRRFPNRVYIMAKKREPFAFLALNNTDVLLDEEGVVLGFEPLSRQRLPVISGVVLNRQATLGQPLRYKKLNTALNVIKEIQANEYLGMYQMAAIDVANLSKIQFEFSNDLKVIIDRERINEKVSKLGILLSQGNLDTAKINYIDLRFKEPVLNQH